MLTIPPSSFEAAALSPQGSFFLAWKEGEGGEGAASALLCCIWIDAASDEGGRKGDWEMGLPACLPASLRRRGRPARCRRGKEEGFFVSPPPLF